MEYKLKLLNPTASRFEHLVTQMKWRLREGQGEAIYEIGVADNGFLRGLSDAEMDDSIATLKKMADRYDYSSIVYIYYTEQLLMLDKVHYTLASCLLCYHAITARNLRLAKRY